MLSNLYIKRLVRTYGTIILDEHQIDKIAKESATLTPEDIGIKQELLNKAAARIEQALRESGIDPNRMTNEELMLFLLDMFKNLGEIPSTISDELLEKSAIALAEELKKIEHNRSGYTHGYGRSNRPFSSIKNFSKLTTAITMIPTFLSTLLGGKLNAAKVISQMANNPTVVEMAVEKTVLENIMPKDSLIRYRKEVKPEKSLIETIRPALEEIRKYGGTSLYEKYNHFTDAGALMPLPEKDTLDPETRIAFRLYKSAKIIYNKFRNKDAVPFDTLLYSDEKTEIATQYVVFAAMAYNILSKLDYAALGMTPAQINDLIHDLRVGMYDVKFKNDNNTTISSFSRNILIQMLNSDIEFEIRLNEMKVLGLGQVNNEIREQLMKYKVAVALVKGTPLYDIYVVLPVLVTHDSMNPVHEVVFRIRCDLSVYGTQQSSVSQANANTNSSPFRRKRARPFGRKKKYDWM